MYTERENKKLKEDNTMQEIKKFEAIIANPDANEGKDVNYTLFWAYRYSREAGQECINFDDVIWDYDIEEIVKTLRDEGVTEFTISSTFSSLLTTIAEFTKKGCRLEGMTEVNSRFPSWGTNEYQRIPALKLSL